MTTTTIITDALRAAIDMISIDRQSFADCNARPDGSISDADGLILRESVIPHDDDQQQWKLVPVTPTPEMIAAVSWPGCAVTDYAHMLAAAPQPPSAQPTLTAEIVERRLRTWRQRFVNRSGDQLALDDFLDRESLDDLVDFVCDEYSKEAKR